jgi:hypothetical protein
MGKRWLLPVLIISLLLLTCNLILATSCAYCNGGVCNQKCESGESSTYCTDCATQSSYCGDGRCDSGETCSCSDCPCGYKTTCSSGSCVSCAPCSVGATKCASSSQQQTCVAYGTNGCTKWDTPTTCPSGVCKTPYTSPWKNFCHSLA